MHTPYVYVIESKVTGHRYIGVRYARGCEPGDLMVSYFTSSKIVNTMTRVFGVDSWKIEIIGVFPDNPVSAILFEADLLAETRKNPELYLNVTTVNGFADPTINSKAGSVGGRIVKSAGIGIFRDPDERLKWSSMGGKSGARVQMEKKIGIHSQTREERLAFASAGGKKGAFTQSRWQSEFGKRGGVKNAGSSFYTDGIATYKYTARMKETMSLEEFLSDKPQFRKGRTINARNRYTKDRSSGSDG
jgi:hypothetical protein